MKPALLHFDRTPVADFAALVDGFPDKELCSPTRSNIPLLAMVRQDGPVLNEILAATRMPAGAFRHFEFTVPPPVGRGYPSCSDLMLCAGTDSLAVEAKWTEPRYERVGSWLAQGKDPANREAVLAGWLGLLQPHATRSLKIGDFSACIYQLVHRAASACAAASSAGSPRFIYLIFRSAETMASAHYGQSDLHVLWECLGRPAGFPFFFVEVPLAPSPAFAAIADLPKRQLKTAPRLRSALLGEPLFVFGAPLIHRLA